MAVIKKVLPKGLKVAPQEVGEKASVKKAVSRVENNNRDEEKVTSAKGNVLEQGRPKKVCYFCKSKSSPKYWDAAALRKFMNDRGRIAPKARVGTCAKHQRCVSREIKRARHLALLPFTVRI